MNALDPRNGTSLTNIIDVTAHSISLFQGENEPPKDINDIFIPQTNISIAEPIEYTYVYIVVCTYVHICIYVYIYITMLNYLDNSCLSYQLT